MATMTLRSLTVTLAILLVPSLASAHAALSDPTPRSTENGLTTEPCGDLPAGAPTMFMAGETITVSWAVGQGHGGFLQIDFAEADDVFGETILATDIPDTEGSPTSMDVTLPDVDCDACTLRLIQINPDEANYVSCADVQLVGGGGSSSGGTEGSGSGSTGGESSGGPIGTTGDPDDTTSTGPDGTTSATASASTSTAGNDTSATDDGSGTTDAEEDDSSGGCGCRSTGDATPLALGLLVLFAVRRRRA